MMFAENQDLLREIEMAQKEREFTRVQKERFRMMEEGQYVEDISPHKQST